MQAWVTFGRLRSRCFSFPLESACHIGSLPIAAMACDSSSFFTVTVGSPSVCTVINTSYKHGGRSLVLLVFLRLFLLKCPLSFGVCITTKYAFVHSTLITAVCTRHIISAQSGVLCLQIPAEICLNPIYSSYTEECNTRYSASSPGNLCVKQRRAMRNLFP